MGFLLVKVIGCKVICLEGQFSLDKTELHCNLSDITQVKYTSRQKFIVGGVHCTPDCVLRAH